MGSVGVVMPWLNAQYSVRGMSHKSGKEEGGKRSAVAAGRKRYVQLTNMESDWLLKLKDY